MSRNHCAKRQETSGILPVSWRECQRQGWHSLDVLLVTGDAYVDHPAFGVAIIARVLAAEGLKVAVLAQPRYGQLDDFRQFPEPKLFCGITAGNLDSIVANYTGNGKVREKDAYSPGGSPWRDGSHTRGNRYRPDRACLVYSHLARATFPSAPLILGGIEASLRRFVHYDYQQHKLRASILTDAKADLLVYGMGERAAREIVRRLRAGEPLAGIPGTCQRLTAKERDDCGDTDGLELASYESVLAEPKRFLETELTIDQLARQNDRRILWQRQGSHWLAQHPPATPLSANEIDALYALPFTRRAHPTAGEVPAARMIAHSVTVVRGCSGGCSFCAITRHQGVAVQSRSRVSIVAECEKIASQDDFTGTISDLGGPTANLYATTCAISGCRRHDCLYPKVCKRLRTNEREFLELLREVGAIAGVRHVFISSGLRMELLRRTPRLLKEIFDKHCPGVLKIAPEHSSDNVLRLMRKEKHQELLQLLALCQAIGQELGKPARLSLYLLSAHPGATAEDARKLASHMKTLGVTVAACQDFTPTPGTIATAMYVSGLDRDTGQPIAVARRAAERMRQRKMIEELLPGKRR
ncbi:MAG: YgiQ family radical SAM protein [Desulfobulbaceae bacterium]|nr:YgiQ family radical SAM protein [Desulfobulbaceae bacterium]